MPARGQGIGVLVVGHEPSLRETYALLFDAAGYRAHPTELNHSPSRLKAGAFALLVMDHTLSKEERTSLVELARQLAPNIKVAALHASAQDCGADLVMDSREGAEAILERVAALVDSQTRQR